MSALSHDVVKKFCEICSWAYQASLTHREIFDDNPYPEVLADTRYGYLFERLSIITQEYALHQIVKLHDPAVQGKDINLTLDYVVRYGRWDAPTMVKLTELKKNLDAFAGVLVKARNKILSHNDLEAHLHDQPLGSFSKDADREYFASLQEFVNLVHDKVIGGPFPFDDLVSNDIACFIANLRSSLPQAEGVQEYGSPTS